MPCGTTFPNFNNGDASKLKPKEHEEVSASMQPRCVAAYAAIVRIGVAAKKKAMSGEFPSQELRTRHSLVGMTTK